MEKGKDSSSKFSYEIEVPGLATELQPIAKQDIRKLIEPIKAIALKRGLPFLLGKIRITDCFEDDVNDVLEKQFGVAAYSAKKTHVQAIGKTLWIRSSQGQITFTVLIDANQLGTWNLSNSRCITTVIHELGHILYEAQHIERLGVEQYTADTISKEAMFDGIATTILDEFDVNRLVDLFVRSYCKKDDGQPCSLYELKEMQNEDWPTTLINSLEKMPLTITTTVQQYRYGHIDIEALDKDICPYLTELLTQLSYTASIYMETEQWPSIVECIKKTKAYKRFLREHLGTVLGELEHRQEQFSDSIRTISFAVEDIFSYCGLRFKNVPQGLYISVRKPAN